MYEGRSDKTCKERRWYDIVVTREPDPEDILKDMSQVISFHIANDPSHPLYRCTHYVIYVPSKGKPPIKCNMPHIENLS